MHTFETDSYSFIETCMYFFNSVITFAVLPSGLTEVKDMFLNIVPPIIRPDGNAAQVITKLKKYMHIPMKLIHILL